MQWTTDFVSEIPRQYLDTFGFILLPLKNNIRPLSNVYSYEYRTQHTIYVWKREEISDTKIPQNDLMSDEVSIKIHEQRIHWFLSKLSTPRLHIIVLNWVVFVLSYSLDMYDIDLSMPVSVIGVQVSLDTFTPATLALIDFFSHKLLANRSWWGCNQFDSMYCCGWSSQNV